MSYRNDCFKLDDPFWNSYENLITDVVVPYQEKVLNDEIEDAEKSHAIENFRLAAKYQETKECTEEFYGMVFQDSDVAKWLEAAAYSMAIKPDKELEKRCDAVIALIAKAQFPDGYLNTYFTVKAPEKRWTNLEEAHELYCAGHMMEAAVAFSEYHGKNELLDIMCRMADHIYQHFIVEKAPGFPGHPEVELALMRMYRCTENKKYLELAKHFIDVRGVDAEYYVKESEKYDWTVWGNDPKDTEYTQSHMPVRQQTKAVGHAVRAVYLYTGMADLARETGDEELKKACETLWNNIVNCQMYITGSIGSAYEKECFTKDYHLPNEAAYAETCASIGLIFFARKMLDMTKNSEYADIMEKALYNGVLAGMELDGTKFFYVNPLEVLPGVSGEAKNLKHALPKRPKWFACACCPPNTARLIASIREYAWSIEENTVYSHLYLGGKMELPFAKDSSLQVTTSYPYEGLVTYKVQTKETAVDMTLALRMPGWSDDTKVMLNNCAAEYENKDGYAYLKKEFHDGDEITLSFELKPVKYYANRNISADSGKVAICCGPLVYCAEGADNQGDVLGLMIDENGTLNLDAYEKDTLKGIRKIQVDGLRVTTGSQLYSTAKPKYEKCKITLVPYYTWGNRGLNEMRVWIPEK